MTTNNKIGWIGTGLMGAPMCQHLINSGYQTYVYNRTREKAENLQSLGAILCESPSEIVEQSDIVFTIVGYPVDVESTYFGAQGILPSAKKGTICVDMTTSRPNLAQTIFKEGQKQSVHCLDAPVSGGPSGAQNGTLSIMVGGEKAIYDRVLPLFEIMGKTIEWMGEAGSGQHTKMCNQTMIASTMVGVVESLLYAYRAGLNPSKVIEILNNGAASSQSLQKFGPAIVNSDYSPGFYLKHFVKDMSIALQEAENMSLSLPGLSLAKQFYLAAVAQGFEEEGTQALFKVLAKMNYLESAI